MLANVDLRLAALTLGGAAVAAAWLARGRESAEASGGAAASDVPSRMEEVSDAFLSRVLRASGAVGAGVRVRVTSVRALDGGVHYQVAQLQLAFERDDDDDDDANAGKSEARPPQAPGSVVVKLFTGKPLAWFERWLLRVDRLLPPRLAKLLWPELHATGLRVHSYSIEASLYQRYSRLLSIPTPRAFFCHGDAARMQFLVVLEDLCGMDRGEPNGFLLRQADHLVSALARFHRSALDNPALQRLLAADGQVWPSGGYWFGPKEMLYGGDIVRGAEHLLAAFGPDVFDAAEAAHVRATARDLARVASRLTSIVHTLSPRVLLHGDYKISNLFIDDADKVFAIDWQWLGGGFPATDLAYFVYTSVMYSELVRDDADVEPRGCVCDERRVAEQRAAAELAAAYDAQTPPPPPPPSRVRRAAPAAAADGDAALQSDREFYHYYGEPEWRLMCVYYEALGDARAQISFELFERAYRLNVI